MSDYSDTLLNLWVFAFLGLVIWLAIKPAAGLDERAKRDD